MVVLLGMDVSNNQNSNLNNQDNKNNKQNNKPKFEFDRLKMYFGEPYKITYEGGEIEVSQPTIGSILHFGERNFYSMLNVFIANTTSYRLQLWSMGVDWNKISDYELFCMLIKSLDVESTKVLFGDLDFRLFDLYSKKIDDTEVITLYNKEQQVEIDENTYKCIAEYLRLMFNIYPKVEKAKNKATKEAMIWEDEMNLTNSKNESYKSTLLPLVSSCVNHPGFKYKLEDLKDMGIVQFMDSVQRLQIYESTTALMKGMYSGMIDTKGLDKNALNFMRDINEK